MEDMMIDQGYEPPSLAPDGRIHRFRAPDEKRGRKSAWYWFIGEAGVFGDWRNGEKFNWFDKEAMRNDHRDKNKERIEKRKRQCIENYTRTEKAKANAKRMAESMWGYAKPEIHPYLLSKGLNKAYGTRMLDPRLLVPLMDVKGDLVNLQRIYPDGSKRFLKGGETDTVYFGIQGYGKPYICEGFATGATIHELTGNTVFCAMNTRNMMSVAVAFRRHKPIIAADNDHETRIRGKLVNPGLSVGMKISHELRLPLVYPVGAGTDFNDLWREVGDKECLKQLKFKVTM